MANKDAVGVPDPMDELFDDEQELMAAAQGAPESDVAASAEEAEAPVEVPAEEAPVEKAPDKKKSKQTTRAKASDASGDRQAPPFWMVLAIAGVALALGVVIGYLAGSAATFAEIQAASEQASGDTSSGGVQMPEGHPDVTVDEEGNATVSEDGSDSSSDASDPLTLANNYFDMGMAAMQSATDEESQAKAADLFNQAVAYYDEYLSSTSSASATVDRAICVFYGGDHDGAIADLEAFVKQDGTFAPAWANLGMFYESHDEQDKAKNAYEQALAAAEKDDTYGVKDYAQQRLDALNNQ